MLLLTLRRANECYAYTAFSRDGRTLYTSTPQGLVRAWRVRDGQMRGCLPHHPITVHAMHSSPAGDYLALSGADGSVVLWDLYLRRAKFWRAHSSVGPLTEIAFSPCKPQLLTWSRTGAFAVWNIDDDVPLYPSHTLPTSIMDIGFNRDGEQLFILPPGGPPYLWNIATGERQLLMTDLDWPATDCFFHMIVNPVSDRLALVWDTGKVILWNYREDLLIYQVPAEDTEYAHVAYSMSNDLVAITATTGRTQLWNRRNEQQASFTSSELTFTQNFLFNGSILIGGLLDGGLWGWQPSSGFNWHLPGQDSASKLAFSAVWAPRGEAVALVSLDGVVWLWRGYTALFDLVWDPAAPRSW